MIEQARRRNATMTRLELNHLREVLIETATAAVAVGARIGKVHVEDIERFSLDAFPEGVLFRRRIENALRHVKADDEHAPPVEPPPGEYLVEYKGDCRSYSVGGHTFERGRPQVILDAALARRLHTEQGFAVTGLPAAE
jgi:hypothetical protein